MHSTMISLMLLLVSLLWTFALAQNQNGTIIRINAGGPGFTDESGNEWAADQYYKSGSTFAVNANATNLPFLYQSERWSNHQEGALIYKIPVPKPGTFFVRLHFAEIRSYVTNPNDRVFSIKIQNQVVFQNVDIIRQAGSPFVPLITTSLVTVGSNDNNNNSEEEEDLTLEFLHGSARNPKISGLEVFSTFSNLYIDSGSDESFTDTLGRVWEADQYYNGGLTWFTDENIAGTTIIDTVYQTERYWKDDYDGVPLRYTIPVSSPGKMYLVSLHFADVYYGTHSIGARVFDVSIEGNTVSSKLDLYKEGGEEGYKAIVKSWIVQVKGDTLTVEFSHVQQNPTVAGIEIHGIDGLDDSNSSAIITIPQSEIMKNKALSTPRSAPIRINAGSDSTIKDGVDEWEPDIYFSVGTSQSLFTDNSISGTPFGSLYKTARVGKVFNYSIPIENGAYKVSLHFAEIAQDKQTAGVRMMDVTIQETLVMESLDIFEKVGGFASYVVDVPTVVENKMLSIAMSSSIGKAIISAIAVTVDAATDVDAVNAPIPHYAHAVPGGPYDLVDTDGDGVEMVSVDGRFSHTHLPGASLKRWTWMVDGVIVGTDEETTSFELPVGVHTLILEVEDSGNFSASDFTVVTVRHSTYPNIKSLSPGSGSIVGGNELTIFGSGFNFTADETAVLIDSVWLTSDDITLLDSETIQIKQMPATDLPGVVDVSIKTPLGTSTPASYTYLDEELPPIQFEGHTLLNYIREPTCLAFDRFGRLYIGTENGEIVRLTLDAQYEVVDEMTSSVIADSESVKRVIMGIAFDRSTSVIAGFFMGSSSQ